MVEEAVEYEGKINDSTTLHCTNLVLIFFQLKMRLA